MLGVAAAPAGTGGGVGGAGATMGGGSGGRTGPTESAGGTGGGGGTAGALGGGAGGGDTGSTCTSTRGGGGEGGVARLEGAVVQAESDSEPRTIHAPSRALFIACLTLRRRATTTLGRRALRHGRRRFRVGPRDLGRLARHGLTGANL